MFRRCSRRLFDNWKEKSVFPGDQRGRFNLDEAAAELNLDANYVHSLYKPLHYTFAKKGQRYPSERGRSSRPGGSSSSMGRMFPLYRRDYELDSKLRSVPKSRFSTF